MNKNMMNEHWIEIKRYPDNNPDYKLDFPGIDAYLIHNESQGFVLICDELQINDQLDKDLLTAKKIAEKLLSFSLKKRIHKYELIFGFINNCTSNGCG